MNLFGLLPFSVQIMITIAGGSYILYLMIAKAEPVNGLALSSFVVWTYGLSIHRLLKYLGYSDDLTWSFFLLVHALSAMLLLVGSYYAYTRGSEKNRTALRKLLKTLRDIVIFTVVAFSIIYVLAKLGVLE